MSPPDQITALAVHQAINDLESAIKAFKPLTAAAADTADECQIYGDGEAILELHAAVLDRIHAKLEAVRSAINGYADGEFTEPAIPSSRRNCRGTWCFGEFEPRPADEIADLVDRREAA